MPRKSPESVTEARLSLSNFERTALKEMMELEKAKLASRTFVGTAQALGSAMAGGGLLFAAAAFAAWKAPGVIGNALERAGAATEAALGVNVGRDDEGKLTVTQGIGGLGGKGGLLDASASSIGIPVALRREAQALAKERGAVSAQINSFCSINGSAYDQQKCNLAQERKDRYFEHLTSFRQRVAAWSGPLGNDPSFIYRGLGDIDPDY